MRSRVNILLETSVKGLTAEGRAGILSKATDFYAIVEWRIIWLGTPQTTDSMYYELPGRGTEVRVWPGRYPTVEEAAFYGDTLAPYIVEKMTADPSLRTGGGINGNRGKVTSFRREEDHQALELQDVAWYELQYMLNASKTDADRKALRVKDITVVSGTETFPLTLDKGLGPGYVHKHMSGGKTFEFSLPSAFSEVRKAPVIKAYVDPAAGGNTSKDRTAFAVVGQVGGNLIILQHGHIKGGYDKELMYTLARHLSKWKPCEVCIEKNMGYGAFTQIFQPILKEVGFENNWNPGITEEMVHGAKEVRIIERLGPVMGRGSLWVLDKALEEEKDYTMDLGPGEDARYSLWQQMANITRTKGCLRNDDSVDALAGAVSRFQLELAIDSKKMESSISIRQLEQMAKEILRIPDNEGYPQHSKRKRRKYGYRSFE